MTRPPLFGVSQYSTWPQSFAEDLRLYQANDHYHFGAAPAGDYDFGYKIVLVLALNLLIAAAQRSDNNLK
jgi:hypothetical protein